MTVTQSELDSDPLLLLLLRTDKEVGMGNDCRERAVIISGSDVPSPLFILTVCVCSCIFVNTTI